MLILSERRLGWRSTAFRMKKMRREYAEEERKEKELLASMDSYQKSRYLREKEREKRFGWERRHNREYGQKYGVEATEPLIQEWFLKKFGDYRERGVTDNPHYPKGEGYYEDWVDRFAWAEKECGIGATPPEMDYGSIRVWKEVSGQKTLNKCFVGGVIEKY